MYKSAMDDLHRFKTEIERFLERSRMAPTLFGKECLNDGSFVFDLRKGERMPNFRTVSKVRAFMKDYRARGRGPLERVAV